MEKEVQESMKRRRTAVEVEFAKAISLVRVDLEPVPEIANENFEVTKSPVHLRKLRKVSVDICSKLLDEIIENAVLRSERKRNNPLRQLLHKIKEEFSTYTVDFKLERTFDWPDTDIYEERVLFSLHLNHSRFRLGVISFIESPLFQAGITAVILASSICIALDDPLEGLYCPPAEWSSLTLLLKTLEAVWTAVFTVEMLLQITARGFFLGTKT